MIRITLDLGTNTCLMLIVEVDPKTSKILKVLHDESRIVRLGQGVDQNRKFHPDAMQRALTALLEYSSLVKQLGIDPRSALCVATSQARDAQNSAEFFKEVEHKAGFRFQVISGEDEARLTFLGALLPGMSPEHAAVIDIGGGSTEIISLHEKKSIDVGSVRYTERFLHSDPVTDEEFWQCQESIDQELEVFLAWRKSLKQAPQVVAVAGTVTTLAAWYMGLNRFDAQKIDGLTLTRGDIHRMVEELKWRNTQERRRLPCMEPMRADVILAGAMILWRIMELLDLPECVISTRGLRYGALSLNSESISHSS